MSGGSMGYVCYDLQDKAIGRMMDKELEALLKDFIELLHDCEWANDSDISDEQYFETVREFKKKWFGKRDDRLKEIIDSSLEDLRKELYAMIGEKRG